MTLKTPFETFKKTYGKFGEKIQIFQNILFLKKVQNERGHYSTKIYYFLDLFANIKI